MLRVESVVRGYHAYMDRYMYAVVIKVSGDIVGHVPRKFSKTVYYF